MNSVSNVNETALSSNNILEMDSLVFDQLLKAAADGNIEPFKRIDQQLRLNLLVTPIENTVLHINIPSEKASVEFVEEILEICPSLLLQVNAQGDTPLHVAAKFEHIAIVELLIKRAKAQHEELENGIGAVRQMLRMTNNKGNTALHESLCYNGTVGVVKILVAEDPDFLYPANNCGETPLCIAAENRILHSGATELLRTCSSVALEGSNGKTALSVAVRLNRPGLARKIIDKKKSLTKEVDDNGWTPLHCAAYYGFMKVTRTLLESDKSAVYIGDKYRKMTPLHLAAGQGHIDIIKEIILYCPDCYELVDDRGWNVLHFAMASLSMKKLSSLLENPLIKKLVPVKDAKGNTPLYVLAACARSMNDLSFFSGIVSQVGGNAFAVNKRNVTASNVFNDGYPQLEQEILALSKDIDDRPYPQGVIRLRGNYDEGYFKRMERAKESHLVAAALIATVTFAAAFTLPGGYNSEEGKNQGTAILSRNSAFKAFVITDAIAMVSSISAVFIYFIMSIERLKNYIYLFELSCWITVVAMGAMVIAFVTGTYAVLAPSLWLAIVNCFFGMSFFILLLTVGYNIIIFDFIRGTPWLMRKIRSIEFSILSLFRIRRRRFYL